MAQSRVEATVENLARPLIEPMGYELVDVEFVKEGGRRFLRLYIDKQGGVTLDDCTAVSRAVETRLDEVDPIAEPYYLEVSSPGIERPLKRATDFTRFAGHMVKISTYAPIDGVKSFVGELRSLTDGNVHLWLGAPGPGKTGREVTIPYDKVAKAHLYVEF